MQQSAEFDFIVVGAERFAAEYSADEKRALFYGAAAKAYRLNLD